MKKKVLIFCTLIATSGLTAFAYKNFSHPVIDQKKEVKEEAFDLIKVGARYNTTITKEALRKAVSVLELIPQSIEDRWNLSFESIKITLLEQEKEVNALGTDEVLNADQLRLLQSADYSSKLIVDTQRKNKYSNHEKVKPKVYPISIVPEIEAQYIKGYDVLLSYLRKNLKERTKGIAEDKLRGLQVSFTITKEGNLTNVKLNSTSGFPSVDRTIVELIKNMPGKWNPAENSEGEKVEQELYFFLGTGEC